MTWRPFSDAEKAEIWDSIERGESFRVIGRRLGRAHASIRTFLVDNAGRRPRPPGSSDLRLTRAEREEISRGLAAGSLLRAIAVGMGRAPSTVCREVNANGGRSGYRALVADRSARHRARRPKVAKLAGCPCLRRVVEAGLENYWSPQQISAWLALEYRDDPEMQVSHETIYMSLFVQGRGALRQELHQCLRTGRALRRPKARTKGGFGQGQITNMVMISERPAEAKDRAVPGHWEGDLIYGRRLTCIGTLSSARPATSCSSPSPTGIEPSSCATPWPRRFDRFPPSFVGRSPGPRKGNGRARQVHYRHRHPDLLLRSQVTLAARQQ